MMKTLLAFLLLPSLALAQVTGVRNTTSGHELVINSDGSLNAMSTGTCNPQFLAIDPLSFTIIGGSTYLQGATLVGDTGAGGHAGWCPAPAAGDAAAGKFLKADGTWATAGSSYSFTAPLVNTAGTITCNAASGSQAGCLSSTDWTTFNGKGAGTVTSVAASVPSIFSVSGSPITTSGTLAMTYSGTALPYANGGTNATTNWTVGSLIFAGASAFAQNNARVFWDNTNFRLGINTASPATAAIDTRPSADATGGSIAITSADGSKSVSMGVSNAGVFRIVNQMSGSHTVFAVTGSQDIIALSGGAQNATVAIKPGGATPTSYPTLTVEAGGSQTADLIDFFGTGGTNIANFDKAANLTVPMIKSTAAQTTLSGSAGTMVCSEPEQGTSYKKVLCYLSGFTDTNTQIYTYPTAFSHTPFAYGDATGLAGMTATTTTVKFTVTTDTGFVMLEGY